MLHFSSRLLCFRIVDSEGFGQLDMADSALYTEICQILSTMPLHPLLQAGIWLYHPTEPTARPLLHCVDLIDWDNQKKDKKRALRMLLYATRFLIDRNQHRQARRLAPHIEHLLSEDIEQLSENIEYLSENIDHILSENGTTHKQPDDSVQEFLERLHPVAI